MNAIIQTINKNKTLFYINVFLFFILVNALFARLNWRVDLTRDGLNSVTESTQKVFENINDTVLIEAYISRDVPGELVALLDPNIALLKEMDRVGGDTVRLRLVNPVEEEEKEEARTRGIQGVPIEEARVDRITQREGFFGIYLQVGEKTALVSLVDPERNQIVEDLEYRLLKEIKRMSREGTQSGIGFLKAPGTTESARWQRAEDQHKDNTFGFRMLLERDLGALTDVDPQDPVPADVETLLVVGLPRLEPNEIYHLDQFLMRGGSLICMLKGFDFETGQQDPRLAQLGMAGNAGGYASIPETHLKAMNEWLGRYGVTVNGEVLFEPELSMASMDIQGMFMRRIPNPAWAVYSRETGNIISDIPALKHIDQLVFPWFSGLDLQEAKQTNVKYSVLIQSSDRAITRTNTALGLREIQNVGNSPSDKFVNAAEPVAVLGQGKFRSGFTRETLPESADPTKFRSGQVGDTQGTLVVMGSPYLVSDVLLRSQVNRQVFQLNQAFLMNLLEAVGGDTDLLAARARVRTIARIEPLGPILEKVVMWFNVLFFPVLLGIFGTIRLHGRNKRRGLAVNAGKETKK